MGEFIQKYKLLKLTQEETDNLNHAICPLNKFNSQLKPPAKKIPDSDGSDKFYKIFQKKITLFYTNSSRKKGKNTQK